MHRIRILLIAALWLVVLVLAVRLAVVVGGTESGTDVLLSVWRDATVGWFTGNAVPISKMDAEQQAEFWLAETDRILAEEPDNAALAMGAAIVLAGPSFDSIWLRHTKSSSRVPGIPSLPIPNYEAIEQEEQQFEARCARRCLELAEKATELEPDNPAWWRLRAALQFHGIASRIDEPRNPDWLDVLNTAAEHDPDNALYDYLTAATLWERGLEIDFDSPNLDALLIRDPQAVSLAEEYFDRAQSKSQIHGNSSGISSLRTFLDRSSIPSSEHPDAVRTCFRNALVSSRWLGANSWLLCQAMSPEPKRSPAERLALYKKSLRLVEQACKPETADIEFLGIVPLLQTSTTTSIKELLKKHPDSLSADEHAALQSEMTRTELGCRVVVAAARKALPNANPPTPHVSSTFVLAYVFNRTPPVVVILVLLTLLFWGAARLLFRTDEPAIATIGLWSTAITWILGLGLSIVVFGLFPAEVVSQRAQSWIALGIICLVPALAIATGLVYWLRRRRFRFTLGEALLGMVVFALLCGVFTTVPLVWGDPEQWVSQLYIPAKGVDQVAPKVLQVGMNRVNATWGWPAAQWLYYAGPYWATGLSLALLASWYWLRANQRNRKRDDAQRVRRLIGRRVFWHHLFRCLARSSRAMAVLLLIVFLATAPSIVRQAEAHYQNTITWVRDADKHAQAIRREVETIRNDEATMKEMKTDADITVRAALDDTADQEPSP